MTIEVTPPEPNKDLLSFFGTFPPFDFFGLEPKKIPLKIFELEFQQRLYHEAQQQTSVDKLEVFANLLEKEPGIVKKALLETNLIFYDPTRHTGFGTALIWLQWCLANRGVEVSVDELKTRCGYDGVEVFTDALTPPRKGGDDPKAP